MVVLLGLIFTINEMILILILLISKFLSGTVTRATTRVFIFFIGWLVVLGLTAL